MSEENWKDKWKPVQAAIGQQIGNSEAVLGVDAVELSTLRRYLEPLEFGCALHYDADVARRYGYDDVIASYTAIVAYTMPAMWAPGDPPLYVDDALNAQPNRTVLGPDYPDYFPKFSAFFVTDFDIDYLDTAKIGDRLLRRGNKLISCDPKETRVGRGAFVTTENEIAKENGAVIARLRTVVFLYDPHEEIAA